MAGISLDPDQIRTIREGLGLSQREAGSVLGGGPDAFPKYESGAVVPCAALVNLLLVLRENPAAFSTLHPGGCSLNSYAYCWPYCPYC